MNLRECTVFTVDLAKDVFRYRFPHTEIVKPIVRPSMINHVIALMEHAGANIVVIKEEEA